MENIDLIIPIFLFIIAFLYSIVGHGGASGYIAVMMLFNISINEIRPAALILNILVSSIASYKYIKAKRFSLNVFLSFAFVSIPFSFLGGTIHPPLKIIKLIIGIVLFLSAIFMLVRAYLSPDYEIKKLPIFTGLTVGSILGFLSGLTSVGGGIFLSPLLVMFKWANVKNVSGISALFILVNSIAGLSGQWMRGIQVSHSIWIWGIAVLIGGFIGSEFGSKKFNSKVLLCFLFGVLLIASLKMFISSS